MAGIGFALRDLLRKEGLWAIVESQLHGVVAVAGPWFFTILAMALPTLAFEQRQAKATADVFVTLLLYVFSVSLTLTGPFVIVMTRQVSDTLYQRRTDGVVAAFTGTLAVAFGLGAVPVAIGVAVIDLPLEARLHGALSYLLVTMNWIASPLLSTIRQFRALTLAYALGTGSFWLYIRAGAGPTVPDLLMGFNLGMSVTNALVCGLVLRGFPGTAWPMFGILPALWRYRDLALGGLCYGAGIWVDKWLMWTAPERAEVVPGLVAYPTYDTMVFLAYITTVPALSLFIVKAETGFHEACGALYGAIGRHAARDELEGHGAEIVRTFLRAARDVGLLQVSVTALVLLVPTLVLDLGHAPYSGVFMFRFCAMGAAFQSGVLMLTIVLHYFDSRRTVLQLHALFLISNLLLSWISLRAGLRWYGAGYFAAGLLTFIAAWVAVHRTFGDTLYLAFVRQNEALRGAGVGPAGAISWRDASTSPGPLAGRGGVPAAAAP